jgi:hypothetical protein
MRLATLTSVNGDLEDPHIPPRFPPRCLVVCTLACLFRGAQSLQLMKLLMSEAEMYCLTGDQNG